MIIRYAYQTDDLAEARGAWTGALADAVAAARGGLQAECTDGAWHWYDDATAQDYALDDYAGASLGAALLSGHSMSACYSLWCSGPGSDCPEWTDTAMAMLWALDTPNGNDEYHLSGTESDVWADVAHHHDTPEADLRARGWTLRPCDCEPCGEVAQ